MLRHLWELCRLDALDLSGAAAILWGGNDYEAAYEIKLCFEHMLTRETPELELATHDSIFEYSTDYVKKNDPYLKENPIGNKELVLKKYHPTPFISMPIAQ